MSRCGGRQFCPGCGQELIHRDHRHGNESSSALGQILYREGPEKISVTDLDVVARKGLADGSQLLRLLEQKQPGHRYDRPQERTLRLLDDVITHVTGCADAADLHVNARSGVYVIRGEIAGVAEGRKATMFGGPQEIERMRTEERFTIDQHEQLFKWLDPESTVRRRQGR